MTDRRQIDRDKLGAAQQKTERLFIHFSASAAPMAERCERRYPTYLVFAKTENVVPLYVSRQFCVKARDQGRYPISCW
jgi:hypothetical protein